MLAFPNSKINIGLNITEKRTDGFHNIESCFYPVDWCDALEILPSKKTSFRSSGLPIPGDSDNNLCIKAYQLIATDFDIPPAEIHLLKSVPIGAGLGGGSADAAFTIKMIDELFGLHIPLDQQLGYARRLGSDCAFFINNKPAYCYNKGDEFEHIDLNLAGYWIVMVNPGIHISTQQAYSGIQPKKSETDLRSLLSQPINSWKNCVKNDFEATLFPKYSLLPKITDQLYDLGAAYVSMSGSGSTIYGIFQKEIDLSNEFPQYKTWQGMMR